MKYDAVRRPPIGKPRAIERGLTLERANTMLKAGQCDQIEPAGFRDSLDTYAGRFVLLNGKRPVQSDWPNRVLTDREVEVHVRSGGNIGIKAGAGITILDFDDATAEAEMMKTLGALVPTVETGSGKRHYYVGTSEEMPAKIRWKGKIVGEVQRTGAQQVVCPPSVHPDTGREYIWLHEPRGGVQTLPGRWVQALVAASLVRPVGGPGAQDLPSHIKLGDDRGHEADGSEWTGPSAEEVGERASRQPGARRRAGGWKFQCAGCAAEGHDKHMDNAVVRGDGRWGCAVDQRHKRAIAEQLGIGPKLADHPEAKPGDAPTGTVFDGAEDFPTFEPPDYPDWEETR